MSFVYSLMIERVVYVLFVIVYSLFI